MAGHALRLAFMGSPDFAVPTLRALHGAGHTVAAVYCQPPRPARRGQREARCPVHDAALALALPVRTPDNLRRDAGARRDFAALQLDVAVVAAYGLILPPDMLAAPTRGCLNVHASLLPRWRGASPIQAAVLAGDATSGVTIMRMDAGLDTGPTLLRAEVALGPRATASALHDDLAELGAGLVLRALDEAPPAEPQPVEGATYAGKLSRADGRMDWARDATALDRQVRAFTPWPGAFTVLDGHGLKILAAEPAAEPVAKPDDGSGEPGTVLDATKFVVACGHGALRLMRVQRAAGAAMDAAAFLRGHEVPPGTRLG